MATNLQQGQAFLDRLFELTNPSTNPASTVKQNVFDLFFAPTKLVDADDSTITLQVISDLVRDIFTKNYLNYFQTASFDVYNYILDINFVLQGEYQEPVAQAVQTTPSSVETLAHTQELPILQPVQPAIPQDTGLQPQYSFENFVKSKGNQVALTAAIAVSEELGGYYNPLFIYGGPGLGKTHLLHAIGNEIVRHNKYAKVRYVTTEQFVDDFVKDVGINKNEDVFKARYRNLDLLLLDDVQNFIGKAGTTEEFFNTFNALFEKEAQIVITSDRTPEELKVLHERMISRFTMGLTVDIMPPDYEARLAMLMLFAEKAKVQFDNETLSYIASNVRANNGRELQGIIKNANLIAQSSGLNHANVEIAQKALAMTQSTEASAVGAPIRKVVTIPGIIDHISKKYGIPTTTIIGKKRTADVAAARQIAMYLSRELTDESFPKIGLAFGGKDHATVMHAYRKVDKDIEKRPELKTEIEKLIEELTGM
jgi:chromosomal replication initiator protein